MHESVHEKDVFLTLRKKNKFFSCFFYNGMYENGHPNKKHPLYNFSCTILHIKKTKVEWDANDVFDGRFTNNSVIPSKMYVKIIYAWDMKNVKLWRNETNTEYVYCIL